MKKIGIYKLCIVFLCIVALAGYFLPAMHINFSILTIERSASLSLRTAFDNAASPLGDFDLAGTDFSSLFDDSGIMEAVRNRVVISVVSYFGALICLLAVLIFAVLGRFKVARVALLVAALALHIMAGRVVLTVPELANAALVTAVENLLGFFAMFINVSDAIGVALGGGYWVTLVVLAGLVLVEAAAQIRKTISLVLYIF